MQPRLTNFDLGGLQVTNDSNSGQAYWKANLAVLFQCLIVWFVVSFGFGILLVDVLNTIRIGGFQLGFWFAQQGSIYVFLILIYYYVIRMNKIDRDFDVHED
jgi:putative solute:sodium symporter small subunit